MRLGLFFFCKQKTAYEMRIRDWSSDVCSSDLDQAHAVHLAGLRLEAADQQHVAVVVLEVLDAGLDRRRGRLAFAARPRARRLAVCHGDHPAIYAKETRRCRTASLRACSRKDMALTKVVNVLKSIVKMCFNVKSAKSTYSGTTYMDCVRTDPAPKREG